jgi:tRNA (cytidine/uridine-2'-O-)-methyltransferase
MQIVLYRPQIPQNTGNIARTCAVTGTSLRLVSPLGFTLDEHKIKRAGLDYWSLLDILTVDDDWVEKNSSACIFFSSKARLNHTQISYQSNSILVFGSETQGLPDHWHSQWPKQFVRIPMQPLDQARCLNLATSVGIGLYEALRQTDFNLLK